MDNGKVWIEAMAKTLERLDALCAQVDEPGNPRARGPADGTETAGLPA
jgi:hypothetical protein